MILQKLFNKASPDPVGPRFVQVPNRQAGVLVDHDTALQSAAVFACIRVIAQDIAQLPWNVFIKKGPNERERSPMSPVETLLNTRPNPEIKAKTFRETILLHAQVWGNGYAEIVRDGANRPAELWLISPDRVEVMRSRETGRLYYDVSNGRGPNTVIDPSNMFHIQGMSFDGMVGYSMVSLAARDIGLNISLSEFGAQFFGNGATLGGIIEIPETSKITDEGKLNLKKTFNKVHRGPQNAHKTEILDAGMKYTPLGVEPDKGQFTESKQHQVEEICRWFRVPPHKVGHLLRMTFNNVEKLDINYVQESLIPWMVSLEQEADYKLFGVQNNRLYTKLNAAALMRGDAESRMAYYRGMWDMGAMSINEIREKEDMNDIGELGDKRFVQLNLTTLDKAGEQPEPAPPQEPDLNIQSHKYLLTNQIQKLLSKEDKRFNDLKSRYDRQDYIERVSGFLGGHKKKVNEEVQVCISKVLKAFNCDETAAQDAAIAYADKHIEISRAQALKMYDDGILLDINDRAQSTADMLMGTIEKYAKEKL